MSARRCRLTTMNGRGRRLVLVGQTIQAFWYDLSEDFSGLFAFSRTARSVRRAQVMALVSVVRGDPGWDRRRLRCSRRRWGAGG